MRRIISATIAIALALVAPIVYTAGQDADKKVAGGGIAAPGWMGKIDASSAAKGMTINDSKFTAKGPDIQVQTGPPGIYWSAKNVAKGDFSVKAMFKDMKSDAGHPHPVGVFIGGNNLDTDKPTYLYCMAYTNGTFLVRQFVDGQVQPVSKQAPNAAVKGPDASGVSTNEVGWTVKGGKAECVINGTSVASFDAGAAVGNTKLTGTDGIYGLRVAHNMSATISGFGLSK
jgi:hypothetical protein